MSILPSPKWRIQNKNITIYSEYLLNSIFVCIKWKYNNIKMVYLFVLYESIITLKDELLLSKVYLLLLNIVERKFSLWKIPKKL